MTDESPQNPRPRDVPLSQVIAGFEIPALPDVLSRILEVSRDPNSSSRDLEQLIVTEPGLATQLLKLVNSTYYGMRREITSVSQTVVLLGVTVVTSIASGLLLIDTFRSMPGLDQKYVLAVWRRALTAAGLVKTLARETSRESEDTVFLAAMVQDIGRLVLAQHFQKRYAILRADDEFPPVDDERDALGADHAAAGAHLLDGWHFPAEVVALVRDHHELRGSDEAGPEPKLLAACDVLSCHLLETKRLLQKTEAEIDDELEDSLAAAGWSWPEMVAKKDELRSAVTVAKVATDGH